MELNIRNAIESVKLIAEKSGLDPFELGAKFIFEQFDIVDSLIDEAKAKADDLYDIYCMTYKNDFDANVVAEIRKEFSIARDAEVKAKEYRQALTIALKDYKKSCAPAELELIKARGRVRAKKIAEAKPLPAGARDFKVLDKPFMKGYKIMKFNPKDLFGKKVLDAANKVNLLLVKPKEETQDEFRARCAKIREAFSELKKLSEDMLEAGKPYTVDARQAKINNARQSQLTDAIELHYGKTTEMMISIRHCITDLFDDAVHKYLCYGNHEEGMKMVNEVQENLVQIAKTFGVDLKLLGKNARTINYKFWDANNSQLKVGEFYMLSEPTAKRAAHIGRAGLNVLEYNKIPATGSDLLKWLSYATTPGCPMKDADGNFVTVDDVLVLPDTELKRFFENVLVVDDNGNYHLFKDGYETVRDMADGQALLINIPSQQGRGGFAFKYFGLRIADGEFNMVDEIARREGHKIPEFVKNIDGDMVEWRKYKIITSKSAWKWAKYGLTYKEYARRMNKLAESYPNVNLMYTARLADSIEEDDRRKVARQSTQQFFDVTMEQIERLIATDVRKLKALTTMPGIIRKFAGLDKEEKDRTAYEHFIEACPEFLSHPLMQIKVREMFEAKFAEACTKPSVTGIYPYIAEDPVALIKIWIFGMNPDTIGLGYLKPNEINVPGCEEGRKLYFVRYPANHMVGMVRVNHNDDIYKVCGNVCILSIDGDTILRADGDFDGDEASIIKDELLVELCEQINVNRPLIIFPHSKMKATVVEDPIARDRMVAKAIVIANRFGGAVGQYSNLAAKCMYWAGITNGKARSNHLMNAMWAHIGAILAIDLAKTGDMPTWLKTKLEPIEQTYGKMPWNQRFNKHTAEIPFFDPYWDNALVDLGMGGVNATPNMIPLALLDKFDLWTSPDRRIKIDMKGITFDENEVMSNVKNHSTEAVVTPVMFRSIEARNYRDKTDYESDGDNEFKLISDIMNEKEIGCLELFRFVWRNRASLVYKTSKAKITNDKIGNAQMVDGYYEFCHDLMKEFGKNGTNKLFTAMSEEDQMKALANKFMKLALSCKTGAGKKCITEEEKTRRCASILDFTTKVFAYEYYNAVCDSKGIKHRWVKNVATPKEEDIEVPVNEGAENVF